jgi:hypothetical protein
VYCGQQSLSIPVFVAVVSAHRPLASRTRPRRGRGPRWDTFADRVLSRTQPTGQPGRTRVTQPRPHYGLAALATARTRATRCALSHSDQVRTLGPTPAASTCQASDRASLGSSSVPRPPAGPPSRCRSAMVLVTGRAVDRSVATGLERHLSFLAAARTRCTEHLARAASAA